MAVYPWWAGGMAVAAELIAEDYGRRTPQSLDEPQNGNGRYEHDLHRFEDEGGPVCPSE